MSSALEVILLERVESLGNMGEKVRVKPGYARNYLLPQGKALRATEKNVAYFESQKAALEKLNAERRGEAEKQSRKLDGLKVVVIRHASEAGQLYGSVNPRDIAEAITAKTKQQVGRGHVTIPTPLKTLGLFPVTVSLHPEVKVEVTVNIARSEEEAKVQEKTGKALMAQAEAAAKEEADRSAFLDDSAIESEREAAEEQAADDAADAKKAAKRAEKAASKPKKAKAADSDEQPEE